MATGTGKLYGAALLAAFNEEIDIAADTLKCMLTTSSYTPDQDAHNYHDDVTNEVSGDGYTTGGVTLENVTIAYDGGTNTLKIDCDDIVWAAATITARHAVIYDSTPGTSGTNPLIAFITFDGDVSSSASDFTITVDSAGLVTATVS